MKLYSAAMDFFVNRESTTITIYDKTASVQIMEITLTPEQFSSALSRMAMTQCEVDVNEHALPLLNKKLEVSTVEFEIPENYKKDKEELHKLALFACTDGFIPDKYYSSQNSFFKKDGKQYARTNTRKWVEILNETK